MQVAKLDTPVLIYPLVTFRILFGLVMLLGTIRFISLGWVDEHYIQPILHFTYFGFSWIKVGPSWVMYTTHALMLLSAVGIMMGAYYRISAIVFFLTFTYAELIDITYYLNHYYFVSWVALLLIFLPANRYFSYDVCQNNIPSKKFTPWWTIAVLQLMIALVYTFAGIAKINYHWLIEAMPLRIWLPAHHHLPVIGNLLSKEWIAYAFSWAGMLFDCSVFLLLLFKPTRIFTWIILVFFHSITGFLFQIGVFPVVMIVSSLILFSPEWHHQFLLKVQKIIGYGSDHTFSNYSYSTTTLGKAVLVCFVAFHLLFPWRYILYPGNVFWTEEGYRFSWRVMLMEKAGTATFYVRDSLTKREGVVDNSEFLNSHQEKQMAMQPDMILQYAKYLKTEFSKRGVTDPLVRAEVYVTLNGAPSRLLIDPEVNLTALEDSWKAKDWILP